MLSILLSGSQGRMGREVARLAAGAGMRVAAGVDVAGADALFPVFSSFALCQTRADVLIDFTRPENLPGLLDFALAHGMPCVLATTGYNEADFARMDEAARRIPLFQSANMSVGVCLLRALARRAAAALPGFDIEIVEKHHGQKLDAPSGTALSLLDALRDVRPLEPVFGRHSRTQTRGESEIGVHAVRGGTVAGVHEVGFYGENEVITLTHEAQSRTVFAAGALRAARFLADKPAGRYDMDDLLGTL